MKMHDFAPTLEVSFGVWFGSVRFDSIQPRRGACVLVGVRVSEIKREIEEMEPWLGRRRRKEC